MNSEIMVEGNIKLTGQTPDEFIEQLVSVFREVRNILNDDRTLG